MRFETTELLGSRRDFLERSLYAGAGLLLFGGAAPAAAAQQGKLELLDVLPFVDDGRGHIDTTSGEGLEGRRAFDTSTLTSRSLVTPNEKFFIRTRYPRQIDRTKPWEITLGGEVEAARKLAVAELESRTRLLGVHLMECSGSTRNSYFGLMSAARWEGVPFSFVRDLAKPKPAASRVVVAGVDPLVGLHPGASWVFTLEELERAGAALVTRMNGVPLPEDHGFPVRLMVPGWYGCVWIKWVDRIFFVPDGVEATPQMMEYASRTMQRGRPQLAREFLPAVVDSAAMPVRVEMWRAADGALLYRVVGILWGGDRLTDSLAIRFDPEPSFAAVEKLDHRTHTTWTLWSHVWKPAEPGRYRIRLRFEDPQLRTRRMDQGYYHRDVVVREV